MMTHWRDGLAGAGLVLIVLFTLAFAFIFAADSFWYDVRAGRKRPQTAGGDWL